MTDIRPLIDENGEPTFSGDASRPFWNAINRVKGPKTHKTLYAYGCKAQDMESSLERLRRLLAERTEERDELLSSCRDMGARMEAAEAALEVAQEERDAARRELCEMWAAQFDSQYHDANARECAASRGWGYLHAPAVDGKKEREK